jgi:hypothetical protein
LLPRQNQDWLSRRHSFTNGSNGFGVFNKAQDNPAMHKVV